MVFPAPTIRSLSASGTVLCRRRVAGTLSINAVAVNYGERPAISQAPQPGWSFPRAVARLDEKPRMRGLVRVHLSHNVRPFIAPIETGIRRAEIPQKTVTPPIFLARTANPAYA